MKRFLIPVSCLDKHYAYIVEAVFDVVNEKYVPMPDRTKTLFKNKISAAFSNMPFSRA